MCYHPGMIIRLMEPNDYDSVHALWESTPGMGLNSIDDTRSGIEKFLVRNPSTCFVAEEDGRIIGSIIAGNDGRRGSIYHTAVRTDRQRQGIGRSLVEHAMAALEREGISKVFLVVFARNSRGNAFWEKLGFTERHDIIYRNREIIHAERFDS